jgi:hypothetical protein
VIRRAFSMVEVSLATMVGALVLAAALGVFAAMERGDKVLSARAKENFGLEVASGAIASAMGTLVMEAGGQAGANRPAAPTGRPRVMLEVDQSVGLPGMPDVEAARAGTAGSGALTASLSPPQRLELVVSRHPAAVPKRQALFDEAVATGGRGGADTPLAVRGAFELRPEPLRASDGPVAPQRTWTLWWRPLERRVDEMGVEVFAPADDLSVPLATGLLSARWSVFFEGEWKSEHATAAVLDLPAYVKLQITTSAGLQADWLFEVGWSMGPEFKPTGGEGEEEEEEDEAGEVLDEDGQPIQVPGADGGTGGAAGQGTPPRVNPSTVRPPGTRPTAPPGTPPGGGGSAR